MVCSVLSEDLGGFREIITRQAVERALARRPDAFALRDHDWSQVLGRVSADTLRLRLDSRGLEAEIDLPATTTATDLAESVRRGDVRGMSFCFSIPKGGDSWEALGDAVVRTVHDMQIYEITVTARPAYLQTDVKAVRDESVGEFNTRKRNEMELVRLQHILNGL